MVKKKKTSRRKLAEPPSKNSYGGPSPSSNSVSPNTRPPVDRPVDRAGNYIEATTPFPSAAGATASSPAGLTIEQGPQPGGSGIQSGQKVVPTQTAATGNTGTQIFGGYFSEDYLSRLRGRNAAKQWDEMRRGEAQISLLMNAIKNPIKAGNWDFEQYRDEENPGMDETYKMQADLCRRNFFHKIDFNTFKHESLTVIEFGFVIHEMVNDVTFNDPKFGTFNGISSMGFRSQKTIENWQLEPKTGKLIGVNQYTYSDLGGNEFLPGEFLMVITHSKEGDNYEGISALRPMLGAYMRKELYLKLAAIGLERYAIGTPIGTIPKNKERTTEYEEFKQTLESYTSHECSYIILPEGWKIDIQKSEFDANAVKELLTFENTEMVNALVANFLTLGMNGGGGAYALGANLGEFFTTGIQSYADLVCDEINRTAVRRLIDMNYGPQRGYPKLKCSGITNKAGKDLAETIKSLVDARSLDPDMPMKEWVRAQYNMPKADLKTAVALPAIPSGAATNYPKPNDPVVNPMTGKIEPFQPDQLTQNGNNPKLVEHLRSIKLADSKYAQQFDRNKAKLKLLMQTQLEQAYAQMRANLESAYKAASKNGKVAAAKGLALPGMDAYRTQLRELLAEFAAQSIKQARANIPGGKKIRLADAYDPLSPAVRKLIDAQSQMIADSQSADIEKIVQFTFTSSATSTEDIDSILNDVDEKVEPTLEGSTAEGMSIDVAAADSLAHVVNQAAMSFYIDPDAAEEIESFTFTNEDPVSEICIAMNGTTVAAGDPILDQYCTPLHHNCKSRWVPNLNGAKGNPEIGSGDAQANGGLSLTKKALASITLSELTAKARKHIAPHNFVFPATKRYPIHDLSHARAALSRSSGKPEEEKVRAAVHRKYPQLKKKKKG